MTGIVCWYNCLYHVESVTIRHIVMQFTKLSRHDTNNCINTFMNIIRLSDIFILNKAGNSCLFSLVIVLAFRRFTASDYPLVIVILFFEPASTRFEITKIQIEVATFIFTWYCLLMCSHHEYNCLLNNSQASLSCLTPIFLKRKTILPVAWLIDWCLTPTVAVFQLYRGGSRM